MIVWLLTDMEGIAGIDHWEQCFHADNDSPPRRHGCEQLTADVNAAIAGCFDSGATEVRVYDGHAPNRNKGFLPGVIDPRMKQVFDAAENPFRFEGLDESVHAVAIIGQHAMAGTLNGFLDHTQSTKSVCRLLINGEEHGEMSQFALYAGGFGVPLVYVSGDEALCAEARRLFPHARATPTKRGTGWATCELYAPEAVRANIRREIAAAVAEADGANAWRLAPPIEVAIEWAWSGAADNMARVPGVRRPHARTVAWKIGDQRDIYDSPSAAWKPLE